MLRLLRGIRNPDRDARRISIHAVVDPDVLEADGAERVALEGLDEIDHQAIARHGGAVHVQVGVAVPVVLVRTVVKPRAVKVTIEAATADTP